MATALKMPEPKPKSLAAKLAEVVLSVSSVEKRGHNDFHDYDYATAADVLEAVRRGLAERHVVIIPRVTGQQVLTKERQGKAPEFITTAEMKLTLLDGETGETMECPWLGCGQDSGDKGIYKALTGGYKYFLLQLFMIPTGDDPEKSTKKRREPAGADRPEEPLDPGSDDAVILTCATEIGKLTGQHPEDVIKAFSTFMGKDKVTGQPTKEQFFTDPRKQKSEKWKHGVREKLERELHKLGARAAAPDGAPF
jgi:hypothetical protein